MIATCFTSLYKPLAERCIASFARFGLTVEPVPYFGWATGPAAWKANTLLKVLAFSEHALRPSAPDEPMWLLDADVVAVADPSAGLARALAEHDVAVPFVPAFSRDALSRDTRVSAGCVGFMNNAQGITTLKRWASSCSEHLKRTVADLGGLPLYEQLALLDAVESAEKRGARVYHLTPNYGCRPDLAKDYDPVLVHIPASGAAQMKKKVGAPNCPKGA